jgi:hypothetical protein
MQRMYCQVFDCLILWEVVVPYNTGASSFTAGIAAKSVHGTCKIWSLELLQPLEPSRVLQFGQHRGWCTWQGKILVLPLLLCFL